MNMQKSTSLKNASKKTDYQPLLLPPTLSISKCNGSMSATNGGVGRAWSKWSRQRSSFFVVAATVVVTSVLFAIGTNYLLMKATTYPLGNNVSHIGSVQDIARETIDDILMSLESYTSPSSDQRHKLHVGTPQMDIISTSSSIYSNDSEESSSRSSTRLVYLNQSNAYELLWRSTYREHYFAYQVGLDVQKNQAYCGAATVAAVLNSLRVKNSSTELSVEGIDFPNTGAYRPYPYATQANIFNTCTQQTVISNPNVVEDNIDGILTLPYGLNLQQVASLFQCHLSTDRWNIQTFHATPAKAQLPSATLGETIIITDEEDHVRLQKMKSIMIEALRKSRSRLIINYHRMWLGQLGGGHFSPIGAYNEEIDSFLILDVSKYKYPPVWATFAQIYQAMSTIDNCGLWNFPDAQGKLPDDLKRGLNPSLNEEQYQAALQLLDCKPTYRGFLVVDER